MNELIPQLRSMAREGHFDLPAWGTGATPSRLDRLMSWGRANLSLARLAEGHLDAVTILREAGREPRDGWLYGVWASESDARLELVRAADGWRLEGTKRFCSGAPLLDAALVTAWEGEARRLVEVRLSDPAITCSSEWATSALAHTRTSSVHVRSLRVGAGACIEGPDWYFQRPGFWQGALAPAACWAGGALGFLDAMGPGRDAHQRAHRGAVDALCWGMRAVLHEAGREMDAAPSTDGTGGEAAHRRALRVRHLVDQGAREVLDRFGRSEGPRMLAFDEGVAQRHADLHLYLRQCHAERDLEALAG